MCLSLLREMCLSFEWFQLQGESSLNYRAVSWGSCYEQLGAERTHSCQAGKAVSFINKKKGGRLGVVTYCFCSARLQVYLTAFERKHRDIREVRFVAYRLKTGPICACRTAFNIAMKLRKTNNISQSITEIPLTQCMTCW